MMILTTMLLLGSVSVVLPSEARVSGTELRLGAIAQVAGENPLEVERLKAVHLGYAPAPGYSRLLDAHRLLEQIQQAAPGIEVRIVGSRACRVWPETTAIKGSAIEASARTELARHLANTDAEATLVSIPQDIQVPASSTPGVLRSLISATAVHPGVVSVPVRVMVDGSVYRTVWTRWNVEIWGTHSVLVRNVRAGETLRANMFVRQRLALNSSNARGQVLGQAFVLGSVAARDLEQGIVLTERDITRPTLIKAGDTIFFEIKKGAITARVPAVAQEDGARGDRITVTIVSSERQIKGVVASRDLVLMNLGSQL